MFLDFFGIKHTFNIIITRFEFTLTRIKIQISRSKGGITPKDGLYFIQYIPNLYHSQSRLDKSLHIFSDLTTKQMKAINFNERKTI